MVSKYTESKLFSKKWFDYRHLSPEEATWVFVFEYASFCKRYFKFIGKGEKKPLNITDSSIQTIRDEMGIRSWTNMAELRKWADSFCLDYSEFWAVAFDKLNITYFKQYWADIFMTKQYRSSVLCSIQDQREMTLRTSRLKKFVDPSFQTTRIAVDYQRYLVEEARRMFEGVMLERALDDLVASGHLPENMRKKVS